MSLSFDKSNGLCREKFFIDFDGVSIFIPGGGSSVFGSLGGIVLTPPWSKVDKFFSENGGLAHLNPQDGEKKHATAER